MKGLFQVSRVWRSAAALVAAGALTGGSMLTTTSAFADYGKGAQYQIEISDNCTGPTNCGGGGFGVWLWIELNANGTGDYQGADCGHAGPGGGAHSAGAVHDSGDVTWTSDGKTLTITGVGLFGGTQPVTITVPAAYGHYPETTSQVFGIPFPGSAQVQVAP